MPWCSQNGPKSKLGATHLNERWVASTPGSCRPNPSHSARRVNGRSCRNRLFSCRPGAEQQRATSRLSDSSAGCRTADVRAHAARYAAEESGAPAVATGIKAGPGQRAERAPAASILAPFRRALSDRNSPFGKDVFASLLSFRCLVHFSALHKEFPGATVLMPLVVA